MHTLRSKKPSILMSLIAALALLMIGGGIMAQFAVPRGAEGWAKATIDVSEVTSLRAPAMYYPWSLRRGGQGSASFPMSFSAPGDQQRACVPMVQPKSYFPWSGLPLGQPGVYYPWACSGTSFPMGAPSDHRGAPCAWYPMNQPRMFYPMVSPSGWHPDVSAGKGGEKLLSPVDQPDLFSPRSCSGNVWSPMGETNGASYGWQPMIFSWWAAETSHEVSI